MFQFIGMVLGFLAAILGVRACVSAAGVSLSPLEHHCERMVSNLDSRGTKCPEKEILHSARVYYCRHNKDQLKKLDELVTTRFKACVFKKMTAPEIGTAVFSM